VNTCNELRLETDDILQCCTTVKQVKIVWTQKDENDYENAWNTMGL